MPTTYLITGCSRGLGLAMALELSKTDNNIIFATARGDPTPALSALIKSSGERVKYVKLDVTSHSSVEESARQVEALLMGKGLDVLVNNSAVGIHAPGGIETIDNAELESTFATNVSGVHIVTSAFLPILRKGVQKKVVNISSVLGSLSLASIMAFSPTPSYKISKAALNMLTVQYAQDLEEEGFTVFAVNPGWLKTDLGGVETADLNVEVGAKATLALVATHGKESNGKLLNIDLTGREFEGLIENVGKKYDGKVVPW